MFSNVYQALTYEVWDHTCTPQHKHKTSEMCYIMHLLHDKNVLQMCSVSQVPIQLVFLS